MIRVAPEKNLEHHLRAIEMAIRKDLPEESKIYARWSWVRMEVQERRWKPKRNEMETAGSR